MCKNVTLCVQHSTTAEIVTAPSILIARYRLLLAYTICDSRLRCRSGGWGRFRIHTESDSQTDNSRTSYPINMLWLIYALIFLAGLVQTPFLVDLLRLVFPEWKIKRLTNRATNILIIILMTTFFFLGLGNQIYFFTRLLPEVPLRSMKLVCHSILAYWLWINMVVNYYLAVFVHPGGEIVTLNQQLVNESREKRDENKVVDLKSEGDPDRKLKGESNVSTLSDESGKRAGHGNETQVPLEQTPQHGMEWNTKQSHYCKMCQTMVLYKDHHCPFTGNCVGVRNYTYFFLGLVYGTAGLGYGIMVTLFYFGECIFPNAWWYLGLAAGDGNRSYACSEIEPHSGFIFPALGGFAVATILLVFQVFLLFADLSTHDILKNYREFTVLRFGWHRIRGGKFREPNSRLNVLLLRQRKSVLWFLLPVRNAVQ